MLSRALSSATDIQKIVDVTAFIDWNSQLILARIDSKAESVVKAQSVIRYSARRIARCLAELDGNSRFRVALRFYHGWHRGFQPTDSRRAMQNAIFQTDISTLSQRPNVVFSQNMAFGDKLLGALDRRQIARLSIHLPNTLRLRSNGDSEEKMVDTALAADVVTAAFRETAGWIVVMAEDDDLIPPVYAAEAVLRPMGSRVVLLRARGNSNMLSLEDLLVQG